MDFQKLMKISIEDVAGVELAEALYSQADEIIERLGYTKKEYKVASSLVALRLKAIEDVSLIVEEFVFPEDQDEIILEKNQYMEEKLTISNDVITWHSDFMGITDPTQAWHGKMDITVKEVFELYKAEYLYENFKDLIPRDYKAYYERSYGLAGVFKIFVNGVKAR